MLENIKESLESFLDDITSTEVVTLNERSQQLLLYSKIEFEGDQLTLVNKNLNPEVAALHAVLAASAIQGKMALLKMSGIVLDAIKPI